MSPNPERPPVRSGFGGQPHPGSPPVWPRHPRTDEPLTFLLQIDFAETWAATDRRVSTLPTAGLLQLFMRNPTEMAGGGFDGADQAETAVRWYPADALPTDALPTDDSAAPAGPSIRDERIAIDLEWEPVVTYADLVESGSFSEQECVEWLYAHAAHQLQGTPTPVQYDPRIGIPSEPTNEATRLTRWRRAWFPEPETPNEDWELLLQLDRDPRVGLDLPGVLYLMVRTADLSSGDLSQVWTDLQVD
ncbi:MAG: DUF1963 domain-containing protein [Actinomycetota bacterium]